MTHIQTGKEGRFDFRDDYCPFVVVVEVDQHPDGVVPARGLGSTSWGRRLGVRPHGQTQHLGGLGQ